MPLIQIAVGTHHPDAAIGANTDIDGPSDFAAPDHRLGRRCRLTGIGRGPLCGRRREGEAQNLVRRPAALTVPAVTYNLNIFNDTGNLSEVLARPTLVATEGKKSEFFHGAVWHVELSSSAAAGVSGDVTDVPIGIRLELTPSFVAADRIQLDVTAARASIDMQKVSGANAKLRPG